METTFKGKTALITGAASGIGRATALAFARAGASVAVADWDEAGTKETVRQISALGGKAIAIKADVSDPAQVDAMVAQTVTVFGRLDVACNNAGIGGALAPTADYPIDEWDKVISINLRGVWLCMRAELPHLLKQGGAIVNVASILGTVAFANASAYTAAKHGVVGLTKVAALEYSAKGVRVNAICPGFIETPMLEKAGLLDDPVAKQGLIGVHPIGRLGTSEEIAETIVWMASPAASFITGAAVLADGGYCVQ
jgi:NAD(P)-dependent dehydrogenase (short-subunit alcohol dehydrogenase family)